MRKFTVLILKKSITCVAPFRKSTMDNYYKSVRQNCWGWGGNLTDNQLKLIQNRIESYYLDGNSINDASLIDKCDV